MSISPTTGAQVWSALDTGQVGNVPLQPATGEIDRFQQALERAGMIERPAQIDPPVRVAELGNAATATDAQTPADAANAANRAVQGLELSTDAETAGPGTAILEGLGKLRGIFDAELGTINRASGNTNAFDTLGLLDLQAKMVEFSLVVDVTSKLAGKSTQALDSLMKGQ